MTPHLHSTYVDGCYRCDLSRDEVDPADRFAAIWLYCLRNCIGTLPGGPCSDCVRAYAKTGPPEDQS